MKNKGTDLLFSTDEQLQKYYNTSYQLEKDRFANIFGAVEEENIEEVEKSNDISTPKPQRSNDNVTTLSLKLKKLKRINVFLAVLSTFAIIAAAVFALKFFNIF